MADDRPIVVMIAFPASGHAQGTIQMSGYLAQKGYKVYHIGGTEFKEQIERGGAEYIENDFDLMSAFSRVGGLVGMEALVGTMNHLFLDITTKAYGLLKTCLETVKEKYPDRQVVIWHEVMAGGVLPFCYGAPLPRGYDKLPRIVNFQSSINTYRSDEVFPFGIGAPFASTEQERAQCRAAWDGFIAGMEPVTDYANAIYASLGATEKMDENLFNRVMTIGDVTIFPYSASLDFPRSEVGFNGKFVGIFAKPPKGSLDSSPPWWPEIEANSSLPADRRKKLVFVSQGTAHIIYSELIVPTLQALGARDDVIVVAALGAKGASLPDEFDTPPNARVVDYFPYEAVLRHADVFVSNAGFGGYLHGVASGVPMVVAGQGADKADVCQRAEYAGIAVNLRTQTPTEEALGEAIDKVLADPRYKKRAVELQQENEALDGLGTAEKYILGTAD